MSGTGYPSVVVGTATRLDSNGAATTLPLETGDLYTDLSGDGFYVFEKTGVGTGVWHRTTSSFNMTGIDLPTTVVGTANRIDLSGNTLTGVPLQTGDLYVNSVTDKLYVFERAYTSPGVPDLANGAWHQVSVDIATPVLEGIVYGLTERTESHNFGDPGRNTSLGYGSLQAHQDPAQPSQTNYNVALGYGAMPNSLWGQANIAIGADTLGQAVANYVESNIAIGD